MKIRSKKFKEGAGIEFLLLREKWGLKRYRKTRCRDAEKRRILLDLAIKKIVDNERDDFIPIGYKKRKLKISFLSQPKN